MKALLMVTYLCLTTACAGGAPAVVDGAGNVGIANKAIVRSYLDRLVNEGEWNAWPEVFGESVSFNGQTMTMADMKTMTDTFRSILPDMRMTVESQIAEGDTVATRVTVTGTHEGDYMGLKASGEKVSFGGLALDRIEDGKIVEMWHEMDLWGTLLMVADD